MLKIDNLDFSYNQNSILKMINLIINKQEFVGIIGPNGSGKTTLLKNISNILKPDQGVIYLNNHYLNKYSSKELAKLMAVVPQDTQVDFNFSVYDLIMMGRNPYQNRWGQITQKDKEKVKEIMALTDTTGFSNKRINQLSGGERQRVIIARALVQEPQVLLLDEPTASLDINYQGEIFDLLSSLNKELKLTIIVVSHDLNLSSQYCSKLILLNKGEIYKIGKASQVLKRENINKVYQTEVIIKENPFTNRPYIILVPKNKGEKLPNKKRGIVHVICGGGSGKEILEELKTAGYKLSCGILNQGDSDWEMARKLKIELAEIPPFAAIDPESVAYNHKLITKADYIIITDTPFGYGNLANLELLTKIKGKKYILQNKRQIKERDYTKGKAEEYWNCIIKKKNSYFVKDVKEILALLTAFEK